MRRAFAPRATLVLTAGEVGALDDGALARLLDEAVAAGIGDLVIEIDEVPDGVVEAVTGRGLRLLIGITCFHEHGEIAFAADAALRPVGADGRPRERLEWYVGLLPTDAVVVAEIVARCARLAAVPGVSGLVLDFIRWPLHWELELREAGPRLPLASFDRVTLGDFAARSGSPISHEPATAAAEIADAYRNEWEQYRADTVTRVVRLIAEVAHVNGVALGAFVLPEGRARVGQDVAAWEGAVDALYPMTYHAILQRSPAWVGEVVDALEGESRIRVVPILQLTASPEFSGGWDWGEEVGGDELAEATAVARACGAVGFFPGTALSRLVRVRATEPGVSG